MILEPYQRLKPIILPPGYRIDWAKRELEWREKELLPNITTWWHDLPNQTFTSKKTGRSVAFETIGDFTNWHIERWRCLNNIFYLGKEILGFKDFTRLHQDIADWLWATRNVERRGIYVPRDMFKSYLISITRSIWLILNDPEIRIAIAVGLENLGTMVILKTISSIIEQHQKLRNLFPEIFPDKLEADNLYFLSFPRPVGGVRVAGVTVGIIAENKGATGFHYDTCLLDDIVHDKNSDKPEKIEKTKLVLDFLDNIVSNNEELAIKNRFTDVGTFYDHEDMHIDCFIRPHCTPDELRRIRNQRAAQVICNDHVLMIPPFVSASGEWDMNWDDLEKNGEKKYTFVFPERMGAAKLCSKRPNRRSRGSARIFWAQRMMKPVSAEKKIFKDNPPIWTQLPSPLNRIMSIDWAAEEKAGERGDATVMYAIGVDSLGRIYTLGHETGNWSFEGKLQTMFRLFKATHPEDCKNVQIAWDKTSIRMDVDHYSESVARFFDERGVSVSVHAIPRTGGEGTSKEAFIRLMLEDIVACDHLFVTDQDEELLEEMEKFGGKGSHDDHLDAIAMAVKSQFFHPPSGLDASQEGPVKVNPIFYRPSEPPVESGNYRPRYDLSSGYPVRIF